MQPVGASGSSTVAASTANRGSGGSAHPTYAHPHAGGLAPATAAPAGPGFVNAPPATSLSLVPPKQTGSRVSSVGTCSSWPVFEPLCWYVADLSNIPTLDAARIQARFLGLDKFIWNSQRYVVKADHRDSDLTPEQQLATNGITDNQYNAAYVPGLSERLFERVTPYTYDHILEALHAYQDRDDGSRNALLGDTVPASYRGFFGDVSPHARLDAWALYLGLPQRYGTFRLSSTRPQGADATTEYFALTDPKTLDAIVNYARAHQRSSPSMPARGSSASRIYVVDGPRQGGTGPWVDAGTIDGNRVMGHFSIKLGHDERGYFVAYWDLWQLLPRDGREASSVVGVGHPYKIYDRLYFDPRTGRRL